MKTVILGALGVICLAAGLVWLRSARLRQRYLQSIDRNYENDDAYVLARSSTRKDFHSGTLYVLISIGSFATAFSEDDAVAVSFALVVFPALISITWARNSVKEARLSRQRFEIEKRAVEALEQGDLAPKAWASRLAPDDLPDLTGFEVGRVYEAGSGLMAGDFFDIFRISKTRVGAVLGDVAGHGIESSITAFQAKYLLRVFLRQFRDPAQALEELNLQMSKMERGEEFISLVVVVFDTEAGTLRYASAGHPTTWLWHDREVQPLDYTGPLLMLDPDATYFSREIELEHGDFVVLYTDGLAEARSGDTQFGEDRIAQIIRRDPGVAPDVLVKTLIDAAHDFAHGAIGDDVAILAIRRE
ncbi:MAG: PP2C family protein-serine/threonine phosphatase [Acidimicrobiales bacterium]